MNKLKITYKRNNKEVIEKNGKINSFFLLSIFLSN